MVTMDIPHGLGNTAAGNKLLVLTDIRWEMIGPLFSFCVDQLVMCVGQCVCVMISCVAVE